MSYNNFDHGRFTPRIYYDDQIVVGETPYKLWELVSFSLDDITMISQWLRHLA